MFRAVLCAAVCALPLVISASAGAQSYIPLTDEVDLSAPARLGPPTSITQRYVPGAAAPVRPLGLLVDESQPAAPAPIAALEVTTSAPITRTASADLGVGRSVIVVSNVKGISRE